MSLNVCLLISRLLFFEKFAGPPHGQKHKYGMGPHIVRVKTKNILNRRIGLFKKTLSYVELIVLRNLLTIYGAPFLCGLPRLGGSGGASFGTAAVAKREILKGGGA